MKQQNELIFLLDKNVLFIIWDMKYV
jgi:hypothetical protein